MTYLKLFANRLNIFIAEIQENERNCHLLSFAKAN